MKLLRLVSLPILLMLVGFFMGCVDDPSCTDGVQNQFECGIDCGGPCEDCLGTPPPGTPCSSVPTGVGIGTDSDSATDLSGTDSDSGTDDGGTDSDSGTDDGGTDDAGTDDAGTDDDSGTDTDGADTGGGTTGNSVSATVNGEDLVFENFTGSISSQIVSTGGDYILTFGLNGITETGTYTLGPLQQEVSIIAATISGMVCIEGMGSFTIDEINMESTSGTFNFECATGLDLAITNGVFAFSF